MKEKIFLLNWLISEKGYSLEQRKCDKHYCFHYRKKWRWLFQWNCKWRIMRILLVVEVSYYWWHFRQDRIF